MKTRWAGLARVLIVLFAVALFANATVFFVNLSQDMSYNNRYHTLSEMDDAFDRGDYQTIYELALANKYAADAPKVDTSQYEAFGRYYHAYVQWRINGRDEAYKQAMEEEKARITWKKIVSVIEALEAEA